MYIMHKFSNIVIYIYISFDVKPYFTNLSYCYIISVHSVYGPQPFIINEFVLIKYLVFSIIVVKGPLPPSREGRGATF